MERLLTIAVGRRAKWVVIAVWVAVAVLIIGLKLPAKFQDVQKNEPSSFLPAGAESVRALDLTKRFPSGQEFPAVAVFRRAGGLTPSDLATIRRDYASLVAHPPPFTHPPVGFARSPDRTAALLIVRLRPTGSEKALKAAVDNLRGRIRPGPPGVNVKVTGPAGYSRDAVTVFSKINGTLLYATVGLIFVLLALIYRSPVFLWLPLVAVLFAELASRGLGYGIAKAGVTVNGQSAGVLPVLVLGAGTDYALLLVARYREELRRHTNRYEAMDLALRRAGPAILASGVTVIIALLCLRLARVNGTSGLGPISAAGIGLAVLSMLTLLPALLLAGGRRAFWPFIPRYGSSGSDETHGAWRGIAGRIAASPRRVWISGAVVLAILCAGLSVYRGTLTNDQDYRGNVEAVQGQRLLAESFPAGAVAPTVVIVRDVSRVSAVRAALARQPGVASLGPVERGGPGVRFDVILHPAPYSERAQGLIPHLRAVVRSAGGQSALVGGPTAEEKDLSAAAARDNRVIVPIVLAVVFLILAVLLRALMLPLLLVASVILSYLAALGAGSFVFAHFFGYPGEFSTLPLLSFIFLVALGVDYNIFLMARTREEAHRYGTRVGMARGLAVTGAVITSAGIVLAGTFSMLAVLPLKSLTELGFTIAFGVLLDTFIVRSLIVPALVFDAGPPVWWPSALRRERERRIEREPAPGEAAAPV